MMQRRTRERDTSWMKEEAFCLFMNFETRRKRKEGREERMRRGGVI